MTTDDLDLEPPRSGVPVAVAPGPARAPRPSALRAFQWALDTPRALAVTALVGVLSLLPVFGWLVVYGWLGEAHRRLAQHDPRPLPAPRFVDLLAHARAGLGPLVAGQGGALALGVATASLLLALTPPVALALALGQGGLGAALLAASAAGGTLAFSGSAALATAAMTHVELHPREPLTTPALFRAARRAWWPILVASPGFAVLTAASLVLGAACCGAGIIPAIGCVQLAALHLRSQLREAAASEPDEDVPTRQLLPSERRAARPTETRARAARADRRGGGE